uniref:Uncharacterized protein n=1 Tax=Trepomonas sp. PC1 TaxID=1076344 RepID=A0A146K951_9EUKA|eukprot:JAP93340.1 Hypothetical protein TPC1_14419 [Trepomonas sp. PC1]
MLDIDEDHRKQLEENIKDFDADDIQLPPINEQAIRQLMRKIENGESIEIFQPMKIGAYRKDIVAQVMKHKYSSSQELFQLLEKLTFCEEKFAQILIDQSIQQIEFFSDYFLKAPKNEIENIVEWRLNHIIFIYNMRIFGFDEKSKVMFAAALSYFKELNAMAKAFEQVSLTQFTLESIKEQFKFDMVGYFKTAPQIISILLDMLFGIESGTGMLCDLTRDEVFQIIQGAPFTKQFTKKDPTLFVKQFWPEIKQVATNMFRSFQTFNGAVQSQTKQLKRAQEAEKKLIKDLVKHTSFMVQSINALLQSLEFTKKLQSNAVLSSTEEMSMVDIFVDAGNSVMVELPSQRYHVYQFGEESIPLFSCNASQVELDFEYPEEFYKTQKEQLTKLKINLVLDKLQNVNVEHFWSFFNKCESTDDVEYLASVLYNQTKDLEDLQQNLSTQIGKPWFANNLKPTQLLTHFIACMYYNGVELQMKEKDEDEGDDICVACTMQKDISLKEITPLCWMIRELLFYRLISTQHVMTLMLGLAKAIQSQNIKDSSFEPNSRFYKYCTYFTTLCSCTNDYIVLFDEYFFDKVSAEFEKTISFLKNVHCKNDDQKQFILNIKNLTESVFQDLVGENKKICQQRIDHQKHIEKLEKERLRAEYLKRLKEKNPKLYRREIDKDKQMKEKADEEEKELQKKKKEKEEKQKADEQPTITQFIDKLQEAVLEDCKYDEAKNAAITYLNSMRAYDKKKADFYKMEQEKASEEEKMRYQKVTSFDSKKTDKKVFQQVLDVFQRGINFQNIPQMAKFYTALREDLQAGMVLKRADFDYENTIIKSAKTDQKTILVKLVFWQAKLITDDQISNMCYGMIKELKFKQVIPDSDIKQVFMEYKKCVAITDGHISRFLLESGMKLKDQKIIFFGFMTYAGLDDYDSTQMIQPIAEAQTLVDLNQLVQNQEGEFNYEETKVNKVIQIDDAEIDQLLSL